jgi:hypothetical protein
MKSLFNSRSLRFKGFFASKVILERYIRFFGDHIVLGSVPVMYNFPIESRILMILLITSLSFLIALKGT